MVWGIKETRQSVLRTTVTIISQLLVSSTLLYPPQFQELLGCHPTTILPWLPISFFYATSRLSAFRLLTFPVPIFDDNQTSWNYYPCITSSTVLCSSESHLSRSCVQLRSGRKLRLSLLTQTVSNTHPYLCTLKWITYKENVSIFATRPKQLTTVSKVSANSS